MKLTSTMLFSAAGRFAMRALCLSLLAASLTAQAQYLELSTTGLVNPQSLGEMFSICADFNNNGTMMCSSWMGMRLGARQSWTLASTDSVLP